MKFDFIKPIKREREKHITRLHIILFFLVVIGLTTTLIVINVKKSQKLARYTKLENDLKTATVYYIENNKIEIEKGRRKIIRMKTIISSGYLQDELTKNCKGYTIVSNSRNLDGKYELGFEPYIKCGDAYTTSGFEDDITE